MTEIVEFLLNHIEFAAAWVVVAAVLLFVQLRLSALGATSVTSQTLTNLVNRQNAVVIDVRPQVDFNKGHISDAVNIPLSQIKNNLEDLEKYQDRPIIMVCANGQQVGAASEQLRKSGFQNISKLSGGMASWLGENLPLVK